MVWSQMNNSIQKIELQISSLLVEYLEPRWVIDPANRIEVGASTNLTSDLTLDSFQVMEFLMEVEDELDIAVDVNSLSNVHTVSDLARIVAEQLGS
jgi:acyl carrier protein